MLHQGARLGCARAHENAHTRAHQANDLIGADQLLFPCHGGTPDGIVHFRVQMADGGIPVRSKQGHNVSGEKFGLAVQADEISRSSYGTVEYRYSITLVQNSH